MHTIFLCLIASALTVVHSVNAAPGPGNGLPSQFQFVVQGLDGENGIQDFYKAREFRPLWLADDKLARQRLTALTLAVNSAHTHGIPPAAVMNDRLLKLTASDEDPQSRALAELEISRIYLNYARVMDTGLLDPRELSESIAVRKQKSLPDSEYLDGISGSDPVAFLVGLAPQSPAYDALRTELQKLREHVSLGGWGVRVTSGNLGPGQTGPEVIKLRNRLIRMGYINRTATPSYDLEIERGVRSFQVDHGILPSGIANRTTIEAINVSAFERMQQLVSSLERMRWQRHDSQDRKIIVNIPEFLARVYSDGEVLFESNVVVGKTRDDLQTPEFSDIMEYVVVNPNWNVPYSIMTEEILPELIEDENTWGDIEFLDNNKMPIQRVDIDFREFGGARGFPFLARQVPGPSNPLGNVKFMFPNKHNIYLHDSPMRDLFTHAQRAYSHGCVRVMKAHDLARSLLIDEGVDFDGLVRATYGTPDEVHIYLLEKIPVHITYQTVLHTEEGGVEFRNDIYGRDELIYNSIHKLGGNTT